MKAIYSKLPSKKVKCVATIGVFDGIHLGHQYILKKVAKEANKKGLSSLVITFDIPPKHFLGKNFLGYLTDPKSKERLIKSLGIAYLWTLRTNQLLLKLSPENFIAYVLKYFNVKELIIAEDFRFAHRGLGSIKLLEKLALSYGFKLLVIKKKNKGKKIISSSIIRQFIRAGRLTAAAEFLGRKFFLDGRVAKGKGIGRKLGFPTANFLLRDFCLPKKGVYAAYAIVQGETYLAAININGILEAHILEFKRNILGKVIKIILIEKIREEKKFSSWGELSCAIGKDVSFIASKYSIPPQKTIQPLV